MSTSKAPQQHSLGSHPGSQRVFPAALVCGSVTCYGVLADDRLDFWGSFWLSYFLDVFVSL